MAAKLQRIPNTKQPRKTSVMFIAVRLCSLLHDRFQCPTHRKAAPPTEAFAGSRAAEVDIFASRHVWRVRAVLQQRARPLGTARPRSPARYQAGLHQAANC